MSNIKFGLKLWSKNKNLISEAKRLIDGGVFQYVELMVLPGDDISDFEKSGLPFIIHIPHNEFGFNIGEKETAGFSLKIIKQSIELADKLSAQYLILHPGFGKIELAEDVLKNIKDKRILIENMPKVGSGGEKMIGYDLEELVRLEQGKFGFCLDFEHATKAALSMKVDPKIFIKKLLALKPMVFHICDGTMLEGPDMHLGIGEGEYDMDFFLNCIKNNEFNYVTVETSRHNLNSLQEDIENVKKLQKLI